MRNIWNRRGLLLSLGITILFSIVLTGTIYANTFDDILQETWEEPNESDIPDNVQGDMIRYGKELIVNTPKYVGPNSSKPYAGNKLSCSSCHLDAATQPNAVPLYVSSFEYADPGKYSARSGQLTTVEKRINGCFLRSLDGIAMPEDSYEMQSMVAYLDWLSTGKADGISWQEVKGVKTPKLALMDRAADPVQGAKIFHERCSNCHGANGQGEWDESKNRYKFPPLYGNDSFNNGAGMHRNITAASYIKANMPYGDADLTLSQAYDVAAYINSQDRPVKSNLHLDWSADYTKKNVDAPYGPYFPDSFPPEQFKYGPWQPIIDAREALNQ
ncbi:c-type cytochrome [Neobacillus drentensis]|uniref:c-type cytochrome n=1 Tax=Neobacillus drentensis TaxID=220684 RepID=UPI002FFE4BBB